MTQLYRLKGRRLNDLVGSCCVIPSAQKDLPKDWCGMGISLWHHPNLWVGYAFMYFRIDLLYGRVLRLQRRHSRSNQAKAIPDAFAYRWSRNHLLLDH